MAATLIDNSSESEPAHSSTLIEQVGAAGLFAVGAIETDLGWIAVAASQGAVTRLTIGHASRENAIAALRLASDDAGNLHVQYDDIAIVEGLLPRFVDYAAGVPDDFRDVPIHLPELTAFARRVMDQLRQVGYGEKVSYGELAERAGSPRAARAVGHVMATNRIPLILPCHRVVGTGGRLGGFSAPQGIELKRQLLALEGHGEFEA